MPKRSEIEKWGKYQGDTHEPIKVKAIKCPEKNRERIQRRRMLMIMELLEQRKKGQGSRRRSWSISNRKQNWKTKSIWARTEKIAMNRMARILQFLKGTGSNADVAAWTAVAIASITALLIWQVGNSSPTMPWIKEKSISREFSQKEKELQLANAIRKSQKSPKQEQRWRLINNWERSPLTSPEKDKKKQRG